MSVRKFNGANNYIRMSVGACNISAAVSAAACVNIEAQELSGVTNMIGLHTSGGNGTGYLLWVNEKKLSLYNGTTVFNSGITVEPGEGNLLLGWTKPAGTGKVRYYKYKFSTTTWTIEESAGTVGDASAIPSGTVRFNEWQGTEFSTQRIFAGAIWNTQITEANMKALVSAENLLGWNSVASPKGLWLFNQAVVTESVPDQTGNGATQTERNLTEVVVGEPPIPFTTKTVVMKAAVSLSMTFLASLVRARSIKAAQTMTTTLVAKLSRTATAKAALSMATTLKTSFLLTAIVKAAQAMALTMKVGFGRTQLLKATLAVTNTHTAKFLSTRMMKAALTISPTFTAKLAATRFLKAKLEMANLLSVKINTEHNYVPGTYLKTGPGAEDWTKVG